jgi:hypothetical protein
MDPFRLPKNRASLKQVTAGSNQSKLVSHTPTADVCGSHRIECGRKRYSLLAGHFDFKVLNSFGKGEICMDLEPQNN